LFVFCVVLGQIIVPVKEGTKIMVIDFCVMVQTKYPDEGRNENNGDWFWQDAKR
jgi:hypothetical protein